MTDSFSSPYAKGGPKNVVARLVRSRITWLVPAAGGVVVVVARAVFEPWKLWVDRTVNQAAPAVVAASVVASACPPPAAEVMTIARGTFISHEHHTGDTVRMVRGPDVELTTYRSLSVWCAGVPRVLRRGRTHRLIRS